MGFKHCLNREPSDLCPETSSILHSIGVLSVTNHVSPRWNGQNKCNNSHVWTKSHPLFIDIHWSNAFLMVHFLFQYGWFTNFLEHPPENTWHVNCSKHQTTPPPLGAHVVTPPAQHGRSGGTGSETWLSMGNPLVKRWFSHGKPPFFDRGFHGISNCQAMFDSEFSSASYPEGVNKCDIHTFLECSHAGFLLTPGGLWDTKRIVMLCNNPWWSFL